MTTLNDFIARAALKTSTECVPGFGQVTFREMNLADRDAFYTLTRESPRKASAFLVASCVIDETGNTYLKGTESDLAVSVSPEVLEEIGRRVLVLSGLMKAEAEEAPKP